MEPNLRHPPKMMGKNDQRVGAQADRPAILSVSIKLSPKKKKKRSARTSIIIELKKKISECSTELHTNCFSIKKTCCTPFDGSSHVRNSNEKT